MMKNIYIQLKTAASNFVSASQGAAAIEYALIAAATSLALVGTMPTLRTNLGLVYSSIAAFF
jgi:Flp pilus assembly pilin Flp